MSSWGNLSPKATRLIVRVIQQRGAPLTVAKRDNATVKSLVMREILVVDGQQCQLTREAMLDLGAPTIGISESSYFTADAAVRDAWRDNRLWFRAALLCALDNIYNGRLYDEDEQHSQLPLF